MGPVYYTVERLSGDYAFLRSDEGIENQGALALLPAEIDEGSRVKWENFEYFML